MRRHRGLLISIPLCAAVLASCGERPAEVRTYQLGQRAAVGHLTYVAMETQWYAAFGEGPGARAPQNHFLLVRLSVTNGGGSEASVPSLSVDDGSGHRFEELNNGDQVPDWIGMLRTLAPADTLRGNIVFDVPTGNYTLHISNEDEKQEALVDLPLNLQREPLEVPGVDLLKPEPATPKKK